MNGWLTILLLVVANVFMTFAWYGHLKLQDMKVITDNTPLYIVVLLSWGIALAEYFFRYRPTAWVSRAMAARSRLCS